jgi:DNA-binding response OmpR family regulator
MAHILVIDDDDLTQEMVKIILNRRGHTVAQARDGKEGLRAFKAAPTEVVVTDIVMPEQDGLTIIRELRQICARVGIVAISGGSKFWTSEELLPFASKFGARHVLQKPFTESQLVDAVTDLLRPNNGYAQNSDLQAS